jgi:hypothetical protein
MVRDRVESRFVDSSWSVPRTVSETRWRLRGWRPLEREQHPLEVARLQRTSSIRDQCAGDVSGLSQTKSIWGQSRARAEDPGAPLVSMRAIAAAPSNRINRKVTAYLPGLASSIRVRSCPGNALLSFEENHSPSSSSSRTLGESQATYRLHGDHECRCGIHVEW